MADSRPSDNPLVRGLQLLTTGWGYNFYNDANRARADDLLIREKASAYLSEAAAALSALEIGYRQQYIPAATRDTPFPPADVMERWRGIGRLKARISDLGVRLRGASAPTQDKIWFRIRQEQTLLYQLLASDQGMVTGAQHIAELARDISASAWNTDAATATVPIDVALQSLEDALRSRRELLTVPTM